MRGERTKKVKKKKCIAIILLKYTIFLEITFILEYRKKRHKKSNVLSKFLDCTV